MYNVEHQTRAGSGSAYFQAPENMKLAKNFVLSELANTQGEKSLPMYLFSVYSERFNDLLQAFRELYNSPIDPTSGYRQAGYNARVGGDPKSLHLKACACDFIDTYKKSEYFMFSTWLRVLNEAGVIGAINIYNNEGYFRYHIEAFSDVYLGYTKSRIRVYTNRTKFNEYKQVYQPLGVEVVYAGN